MTTIENSNLKFSRRHGPGLPTEVEENVIDHCADDIVTLRHCALTCRDWLPRSRCHLLAAIRISTQEGIYSFCDLLDAHPERRVLVHSITMAPTVTEKRPACLVGAFPIPLLSLLPQLHRWVLRSDLSLGKSKSNLLKVCYHATTLQQLRTFSRIVDLHLQGLSFVSRYELLRFIASFSQLKHLWCDTIGFDRPDSLDSGRPKPRDISKMRLSTLHMRHVCQDVLHTLLESTTSSSSLEVLTVTTSELYSKGQGFNGAVLSQMSKLHSLTFEMSRIEGQGSVVEDLKGWDTMVKTLKGACIPRIKSLRVNVPGPLLPDYNTAQTLTLVILGMKLQLFTVNVNRHSTSSWDRPIYKAFRLMRHFARLCEEGLLLEVRFSNVDAMFFDEQFRTMHPTISPDGRRVAGLIEGGAILWDVDMTSNSTSDRTWRTPPFFPMSVGNLSDIVFSPDGDRLLVTCDESVAHVWDVKRRCLVSTITCHCDPVIGAWSPHCIVLSPRAETVSIYDPSTYQPIQDIGFEFTCWGSLNTDRRAGFQVAFSPDNRWMAASYGVQFGYAWTIWRVSEDGGLARHTLLSDMGDMFGSIHNAHYHRQMGKFNVESTRMTILSHDLRLHQWDVATGTLVLRSELAINVIENAWWGPEVSFSADGQHLLVNRKDKAMIEVYDGATGHFLKCFILEGKSSDEPGWLPFRAPCFSPCGRYVVDPFLSTRGAIVWKTEDGSLVN